MAMSAAKSFYLAIIHYTGFWRTCTTYEYVFQPGRAPFGVSL
jgi:hypothetical protein